MLNAWVVESRRRFDNVVRHSPGPALGMALLLPILALGCASAAAPDDPRGVPARGSGGLSAPAPGGETPPPQVDEQAPPDLPNKSTECPKLESVLYQLTQAPAPESFAQQRGVELQAGMVRVVIDLSQADAPLPEGFGLQEERRVGRQVRVLAPLAQLCQLSEQAGVDFVHLPLKPGSLGPGP